MKGLCPPPSSLVVLLAVGLSLSVLRRSEAAGTEDAWIPANPQRVDAWFRSVASGAAPEREAAIRRLQAALQSNDSLQLDCVVEYPSNKGHCEILLQAIPQLIEALKGEGRREAWWILISLQPFCPPAEHEVWLKWWNRTGQAQFRRLAERP